MISSRIQNVWVNGVSLRDVSPLVIVARIEEPDNDADVTFSNYAARSGRLLASPPTRRGKTVSVVFKIRELYDLPARAAVIEAVNAWAKDGVIELSSRPGRRLRAVCTKRASGGDLRDYQQEYAIQFQTAASPYWESDSEVRIETTAASAVISVPGTAPALMTAKVTVSGSADHIDLTLTDAAGDVSRIWVQDSFSAGDVLTISHDDHGFLIVVKKPTNSSAVSVLDKVNPASTDDFAAGPGVCAADLDVGSGDDPVSFTAEIRARGRWL